MQFFKKAPPILKCMKRFTEKFCLARTGKVSIVRIASGGFFVQSLFRRDPLGGCGYGAEVDSPVKGVSKLLVSVIVPVYNAEKYVSECLESVLRQTYGTIEILCVDDGSMDGSLGVLREYEKRDARVHSISQPNGGVSAARNKGLERASGEYLCFVDADDTLDEQFVETMLGEMKSSETDFVFCSFMYNYDGKLIPKTHRLEKGVYPVAGLLEKLIDDGTMSGILFGSACTAMYKKQIITENSLSFCENLRHNEDGLFNVQYCLHAKRVSVLSDAYLYFYRQTVTSHSKTFFQKDQMALLRKKLYQLYAARNVASLAEPQLMARRVSEAFWQVLALCGSQSSFTMAETVEKLKSLLGEKELLKAYDFIDVPNMGLYKKAYFYLMKRKSPRLLYFATKYVYTFFLNKLSR